MDTWSVTQPRWLVSPWWFAFYKQIFFFSPPTYKKNEELNYICLRGNLSVYKRDKSSHAGGEEGVFMGRRFSPGLTLDPAPQFKCGVTSGSEWKSFLLALWVNVHHWRPQRCLLQPRPETGQLHCGICQPGIILPGQRTIKKHIQVRSVEKTFCKHGLFVSTIVITFWWRSWLRLCLHPLVPRLLLYTG